MTKDVLNHLRDLDENLKDWDSYLENLSAVDFHANRKERHALLHCVMVSLQAAIDIGNHWVSQLTPQRPEYYRSIVQLLIERKAIPSKLGTELKGLFSLRNVLVHQYQSLDLDLLFQHIEKGTRPLRSFLNLAKSAVKKNFR